ncbi:MAG: glycogen/starch synthase [Fibrobacterota bacterium]|nr:glycogen/starch synthase [Chitinispirillaceae bacterium]
MNNHHGEYDHIFQTKIDSWVPINRAVHDFFTQREIDALKRSERTFTCANRTVVFLSFENQFASLGGLAAVAHHLPLWLQKLSEKVLFFTPLHSKNTNTQDALRCGKLVPVFTKKILRICNYQGVLSCYEHVDAPYKSYFLEVDGRFYAGDNPYAYEDKTELLIDSLAFSAAVPFVLAQLGVTSNLIFHAHDWETAPIAITSKLAVISNLINSARTLLTLHNSFDSGIALRHKTLFFGKNIPGETILQCTIPLLNGPLTTVSTPFAHELRHDPLQKGIFTDHLQKVFSMNPPIGVENGMFGEPVSPFSRDAINKAVRGETDDLLNEKAELRNRLLGEIKTIKTDPRVRGSLSITGRNSKTPVFFMSGRLDFMQKGFDVIFNAFVKLTRGSAKLFFCPSSSHTDSKELAFFEKIAERCEGDIIIVPFRLSRDQYNVFLQGASYLLMPSFYEPFGAATEGMMNGTPVVARGTGGLWIQVNPHDGMYVPSFYGLMLDLDKRSEFPTGFLYREDYPDGAALRNWREVIDLEPSKRVKNPLYTAMVDSAFNALKMAITAFGTKKYYGQMVCNGLDSVNQFTWQRAVEKYQKIYDAACYRGSL